MWSQDDDHSDMHNGGDDFDSAGSWDDDDVDEADDDEIAEQVPCPECGRLIYEDTQQCPHCGQWVVVSSGGSRKSLGYIVIVVVILIAIGLFIIR